jgi:hypothetical protein
MSDVNIKTRELFKICAGKECNNEATIKLKIRYIKRVGYFCESCHTELKNLDLIDSEVIDIDQRVGSSLNNKNVK